MRHCRTWIAALTVFGGIRLAADSPAAIDSSDALWRHRQAHANAHLTAQAFEAHEYVDANGDTLRYRLLLPLDYDRDKEYPLVVCLSGIGGWATDNIRQIADCWPANVLVDSTNRRDYPSFVLVPQCPREIDWGDMGPLVFDVIEQIEAEHSIDPQRRYVTGTSMGGFGTWHFITTHPRMFAAGVPICGGGDPERAGEIAHVPVWVFHGVLDDAVPVELSREMVAALRAAGGEPKYTEYPEAETVTLRLVMERPARFGLKMRVPGWSRGVELQ